MKGAIGTAAVLILESAGCDGRKLLLTQRASHLSSHGGEVAFPGGMWEAQDRCLLSTALREAYEEVGVAPGQVEVLGDLPLAHTRAGVKVKPYVGRVDPEVPLVLQDSELTAAFWLPEAFVARDERVRTDVFRVAGAEVWAPAYRFEGFEVWGFTARVMLQFTAAYWGLNLPRVQ